MILKGAYVIAPAQDEGVEDPQACPTLQEKQRAELCCLLVEIATCGGAEEFDCVEQVVELLGSQRLGGGSQSTGIPFQEATGVFSRHPVSTM